MTDPLVEHANQIAYRDMNERKKKKGLPQPRSRADVAKERLHEKTLETVAPKTGYPELDRIIKGFIPGHLYTLTGNENVGKTSLACNFAVRVSKQEKKVLYFALEPENTVVDYLASVQFQKRFDEITEDDILHDDGHIHIFGKDEVSKVSDMVRIIENTPIRYDLIIIDHVGYFIHGETNWIQEQSNAIKALAGLAKRKKTAILMIAHLRKRPSGQKKNYSPTSDDIAGSGAFKQDSTEVMIVIRNFKEEEGSSYEYEDTGTLYVTKTKAGPNGQLELVFTPMSANIMSADDSSLYSTMDEFEQTVHDALIGDESDEWWKKY